MRQEGNPLDLNNLPEDFSSRDGKQVLEDTSSSAGHRKKKSGAKDDSGKVYECRFCSLKFCKSQALGGHMNRHRQERETEMLDRARQLVFSNDNLITQGPQQLGGQPVVHAGYHQAGDPTLPFRSSVCPARLFSGTSTTISPPPPPSQSYMYTSQPSRLISYPPQPINDYFVGHVCPGNPQFMPPESINYTCIGAPVGGGGGGRDMSLQNQQRLDLSPINRYQDGF